MPRSDLSLRIHLWSLQRNHYDRLWALTLLLAGDAADAYNGQQGDVWDAQKDMALAALGALVAAVRKSRHATSSRSRAGDRDSIAAPPEGT